jgi:predicted DNA-binding transcriptional regulator AlpA
VDSISALQRDVPGDKIRRRVLRDLELFPSLPDEALIEIRVVSALLGRSCASIWRDAAHGRLGPPVHIGARSTRWRVGGVRAALRGESKEPDFDGTPPEWKITPNTGPGFERSPRLTNNEAAPSGRRGPSQARMHDATGRVPSKAQLFAPCKVERR